ncbi:hypothetical protein BDW72DRAFT_196301 [Aspergillus terricola var. indicus]
MITVENCPGDLCYAQYAVFVALTGLILVNLKGVVGVWHLRVFKGLSTQYFLSKAGRKQSPGANNNDNASAVSSTTEEQPPQIFSYLITTHRNQPIDCDYNLHKSNSTFFADLDINRAQLLMRLFGGFPKWKPATANTTSDQAEAKAKERSLNVALGGVSCIFKREIKPLQKFEIWSRVLSWDEKWVYVVSYFIRPGMGQKAIGTGSSGGKKKGDEASVNLAILASSLTRYVFKDGRMTIKPVDVLRYNGLYPAGDGEEKIGTEREIERRLAVASALSGMDALPELFGGAKFGVLGRYSDL